MRGIRPLFVYAKIPFRYMGAGAGDLMLSRPDATDDTAMHDALPGHGSAASRIAVLALWGLGKVQLRVRHRLWPAGVSDTRRP